MKRKKETKQWDEKGNTIISIMVLENVKSSSYAHVVEDTNEESVCAMHVVSSMPNDIVEDSFFVEKDYIMKI